MRLRNLIAVVLIIVPVILISGCGKQSEKDIFQKAENAHNSGDPEGAIRAYRELIKEYPNSKNCPKAQFMIGYVYAEELADTGKAIDAFEEFIRKYPDNGLKTSADFMVKNLKGEEKVPIPLNSQP